MLTSPSLHLEITTASTHSSSSRSRTTTTSTFANRLSAPPGGTLGSNGGRSRAEAHQIDSDGSDLVDEVSDKDNSDISDLSDDEDATDQDRDSVGGLLSRFGASNGAEDVSDQENRKPSLPEG